MLIYVKHAPYFVILKAVIARPLGRATGSIAMRLCKLNQPFWVFLLVADLNID
jgi:hypothetical protein